MRLCHLARFTLAFCPPLRVTPLSPTRVRSPLANSSISYYYNKCMHLCLRHTKWCSLPFPEHRPPPLCCTRQACRAVQTECSPSGWLKIPMTPGWHRPHCLSLSHHPSLLAAPSADTAVGWTVVDKMDHDMLCDGFDGSPFQLQLAQLQPSTVCPIIITT